MKDSKMRRSLSSVSFFGFFWNFEEETQKGDGEEGEEEGGRRRRRKNRILSSIF